uniref:coiled-coil domain-containing protein 57 isoform X1 n=1 Tax=Myxine glutinosa TaxID=7769 RepID=UPI00358EBD35
MDIATASRVHGDQPSDLVSDLAQLVAKKESEWREAQALRMKALEDALHEKEEELQDERNKLQHLKKDFKYNLRLLAERDEELVKHDNTAAAIVVIERQRKEEISDLRVQLDRLHVSAESAAWERDEAKQRIDKITRGHRMELQASHRAGQVEIAEMREEMEKVQQHLQKITSEVQAKLDIQKQELKATFDSELRRREHEFRLRANEMTNSVHAYELEARKLSVIVGNLQATNKRQAVALQKAEDRSRELDGTVRDGVWELENMRVLWQARIQELEQLHEDDVIRRTEHEALQRRFAEADMLARERGAAITSLRETFTLKEQAIHCVNGELQQQLECVREELQKKKERYNEELAERNAELERLRQVEAMLRVGCNERGMRQVRDVARVAAERDTTVQKADGLALQLSASQLDLEQYKTQVSHKAKESAKHRQDEAGNELESLQKQNAALRGVITAMRMEMEVLHKQLGQKTSPQTIADQTQISNADEKCLRMDREMNAAVRPDHQLDRLIEVLTRLAEQATHLEILPSLPSTRSTHNTALPSSHMHRLPLGPMNRSEEPVAVVDRDGAKEVHRLQGLLCGASRKIEGLMSEQMRLINAGNRLRAHLAQHGIMDSDEDENAEPDFSMPSQQLMQPTCSKHVPSPPSALLSSDGGGSSLCEVWGLLETTISSINELHDAETSVHDRSHIGVKSHKAEELPEKDQTPGPLEPDAKRATVHHRENARTVPGKGQVNRIVRKEGNKPRIRNYNIRD